MTHMEFLNTAWQVQANQSGQDSVAALSSRGVNFGYGVTILEHQHFRLSPLVIWGARFIEGGRGLF